MNNTGGSAFPQTLPGHPIERGVTLRDYFAAKALQGFIGTAHEENMNFDEVALAAYKYAGAMLKAREA